jgi:tRNA1Val (adenine37-N6)-methyltransferase
MTYPTTKRCNALIRIYSFSKMASTTNETTLDAVFEGRVLLNQPRRGHRFAVDSPLLAWFAHQGRQAQICLDLGAGCGVVGLGLLAAGATRELVAVEIQQRLAELCELNAELNGLASRVRVVRGDALTDDARLPPGGFDLVVTNPPFWPPDSGQLPENEERRIANHEVALNLGDWTTRAAELLSPRRGRLCAVFPARRTDELLAAIVRAGLSATRLLAVQPRADDPAELVLLEARSGAPGRLVVQPPLLLHGPDGEDTAPAAEILSGRFSERLRARGDRRTD